MPTIGYILGNIIGKILFKFKKIDFKKTRLYKKLEKENSLYEFIDTINNEINKENTIKYYDDICGIGLLITETWVVYIDSKHPKIIKTCDVLKISDEIDNKSKSFLCIELNNGKCVHFDCLGINEIEMETKIKYSNIQIGYRIIED